MACIKKKENTKNEELYFLKGSLFAFPEDASSALQHFFFLRFKLSIVKVSGACRNFLLRIGYIGEEASNQLSWRFSSTSPLKKGKSPLTLWLFQIYYVLRMPFWKPRDAFAKGGLVSAFG